MAPWQPPASAHLHSGPPSASSSSWTGPSLATRLRPNLSGLTAFQREQQFSKHYSDASRVPSPPKRSEWDVLRENHRFIRDDEEVGQVTWEERLARAYESKLFKEFALIDLKHYKSRRLALRWRTAPEVVEGIGEDTCGSLRCKWHEPRVAPGGRAGDSDVAVGWEDLSDDDKEDRRGRRGSDQPDGRGDADRADKERQRKRKERKRTTETTMPDLRSFELPFVYEEAGERKEALVKVRLCPRCTGKLLWKPEEERDPRGTEGRNREESGRDREREAERVQRRKDGSHGRGRKEEEKRERERVRKSEREGKTERETHTETERDERRRRDPERRYEVRERETLRSRSRSPAMRDRREQDKRREGR
ncbi:hypothetical protein JCM24511_01086 [Saitozyma sp. JCM 24511]|nr:hypothetical protein JCM24511_01086 [Saitozyma sp. JCM 24511]